MKWLPRSLLWRTFALLALLGAITTSAWFLIFSAYERLPRAAQVAQNMASVVNITRAALVMAQPDRRRELLADLSHREGIEIYPAESDDAVATLSDSPFKDRKSTRLNSSHT